MQGSCLHSPTVISVPITELDHVTPAFWRLKSVRNADCLIIERCYLHIFYLIGSEEVSATGRSLVKSPTDCGYVERGWTKKERKKERKKGRKKGRKEGRKEGRKKER